MNKIGNTATSLFHQLTVYAAFGVRYIVFIGRKYPLIAAIFLFFYAFFFYKIFFSQPSVSNLPLPPQTSTFNSLPNTSPNTAPVVSVARAKAYKSGNQITIRWNQPVEEPKFIADNQNLNATCQPSSCVVNIPERISQLKAIWQENNQTFSKNFRF